MVGLESFLTAVSDLAPSLQRHRGKFSFLVTIVCFGIGLLFCMEGGIHTFKIFDRFGASGFALLWLSFWESIAIGYGYGAEKYLKTIGRMSGKFTYYDIIILIIIILIIIIDKEN